MPLIIISGLPTSGKTHRAKQLETYLSERISTASKESPATPPYRLHVISDQTLAIPRTAYDLSTVPAHERSANAAEKDARAALYAAVKRALVGERDLVILDGLNYIKGWRYQLFCEAKAARTPCCVLRVGCSVEKAREVNERRLRRRRRREGHGARVSDDEGGEERAASNEDDLGDDEDSEEPYESANWEELVARYEEPNPMTRWDSPLFALVWEDDDARAREVFDGIWDAVAGGARKPVRPNQATLQRGRDAGGDRLYLLDRETQDIVRRILEVQEQGEEGGEVKIPIGGAREETIGRGQELVVQLPGRKVGLPQLQRYRRAYVALNRGGIGLESAGELAVGRIRESFAGYLNDAFDKDD